MQLLSQLTIHGKFRLVATNPLPMDPLPIVSVYVPYHDEIFKVRSPVGNFPEDSKLSLFGTPPDRRAWAYKHEYKKSERDHGSEQISKPFNVRRDLWQTYSISNY
jgi:hypothetical protein